MIPIKRPCNIILQNTLCKSMCASAYTSVTSMVNWVLYEIQVAHFSMLKSWSGPVRFENWHQHLAENLKLRFDRLQLSLGITLSAAFAIPPREPGHSQRTQTWVSRSDTTVRLRHHKGGGDVQLHCVWPFLWRHKVFSSYSVIHKNRI